MMIGSTLGFKRQTISLTYLKLMTSTTEKVCRRIKTYKKRIGRLSAWGSGNFNLHLFKTKEMQDQIHKRARENTNIEEEEPSTMEGGTISSTTRGMKKGKSKPKPKSPNKNKTKAKGKGKR